MKKRSPVKNGDRFLSLYLTATSAILWLNFLEVAVELAAQDCKFSPFGIETHRQIPPYLSTTICQLIDSPIPVPLPLDFLVKNGSNILPALPH